MRKGVSALFSKAGVPLWSDEHFRLMENSFRLLARAGNDILHIPIIQRTEFGNWEDSMVRWVRGKDGKITFDFSRLDRDGDDPTFLATWADAQFYKDSK